MRILSLDLGTKSLGSCVSDPSNLIAIPVENYIFDNENYELAVDRVLELTDQYNVGTILLGHPKRQDGTKSDMTIISEQFFEKLKLKLSNVKIILFDERYSTKRGIELLENKYNKNKDEIKKNKDMAAAYVMLVDYLSLN